MRLEPTSMSISVCECGAETFCAWVSFYDTEASRYYGSLFCSGCGRVAEKHVLTINAKRDVKESGAPEARGPGADVERNEALGNGGDITCAVVSTKGKTPHRPKTGRRDGRENGELGDYYRPNEIKNLSGKWPWNIAGVSKSTWYKCLRTQKRLEINNHTLKTASSQAS